MREESWERGWVRAERISIMCAVECRGDSVGGPIEHRSVQLGTEVLDLLLRFEFVNAQQEPKKGFVIAVWIRTTWWRRGERMHRMLN